MENKIIIKGLRQNNLKNISLEIPKEKIVVFTGVSGSGKSSIVFDTIAAESQRQMNETYTAFMRGRLPKYEKPRVDHIDNLTASVIIDQSRLGGNARSTVGTISDLYASIRLLYSRIGTPYVGTASYFSFNDPNGMCMECSGIGKVMEVDKGNTVLVVEHDKDIISIADEVIDVGPLAGKAGGQILFQGSYESLLLADTKTGKAMREQIGLKKAPREATEYLHIENANLHNLKNISVDIPLNILTVVTGVAGSGKSTLIRDVFAKQYEDRVVLVDQSPVTATGRSTPATFLGFFDEIRKLMAAESGQDASLFTFNGAGACPDCKGRGVVITELVFMDPVTTVCETCEGKRYSKEALRYTYHGKNIMEILDISVEEACEFFGDNRKISKRLKAMMEVGLPYLSLGQPLSTLSGGERQRVKLAKELDKKGNIYILDEPTTGLHASDIKSIMALLEKLVKRGNTVIVIEHNLDVMKQADYIIDIGPDGGTGRGD